MGQRIRTAHKFVFYVVLLFLVIADVDGYLID